MNKDFEDVKKDVDATADEQEAFKKYLKFLGKDPDIKVLDISIPYFNIPIGVALATGVLYIRDPVENSSTDGVLAGAVIGTYHFDKDKTENSFYDPTGALYRIDLKISFNDKNLVGRSCSRSNRFPFPWRCGGWVLLASW